jgi:hypothetical protein
MVTLRVMGDGSRAASHVTETLGIEPTASFEVGDPVGRGSDKTRTHSGWLLQNTVTPEDGVELADALRRVIELVEPAAASLWGLESEGYRVNWSCYLGSHAAEHAAELDRRTLERLLALPGDLWLDVYSDLFAAER